jgi:hypothetical protein
MPQVNIILPDFIIIGANKAGTTSIANYLLQHPEIRISAVKEPMFFSSDPTKISAEKSQATLKKPYFTVTLNEYSSMFENYSSTVKCFGEASTSYLANPFLTSQLIKKIVPSVKLIAILREPASRALSAYKMCLGNKIEDRSFKEIVRDVTKQTTIQKNHGVKEYIRNGLYSQLLIPYLDLFERHQILFLRYDDLNQDAATFMNMIAYFLGVSPFFFKTDKRYNSAEDNLKDPIRIEKEDFERLRNFYQKDIAKTEKITGLDLSKWKI